MPLNRSLRRVLLVSISITALAACSGSGPQSRQQAKTSAPIPPITEMDTAKAAPQPLAPGDTLTPAMPQAMAQSSIEERIAKLEESVNTMQDQYQKIMPAFASLNTTNARIQALLGEIEKQTGKKVALAEPAPEAESAAVETTITEEETPVGTILKVEQGTTAKPAPAASTSAATEKKTAPMAATTAAFAPPLSALKEQPAEDDAAAKSAEMAAAAPAAGGDSTVTGVRIGEHGAKTRLVFDLNAKTKPSFKYDIDNAEKLLLVEMPSSSWTASQSGKAKSPLIESWSASKGPDGGSAVAIQLKKDARILSTEFLKAEGKDPARLVVDIAPQG